MEVRRIPMRLARSTLPAIIALVLFGVSSKATGSDEDGIPPTGEVFHDFGIAGLEVTPAGEGLYDVDVELVVIPEAPPTQPIHVEVRSSDSQPVGTLTIPTVGLPPYTCCVSTCAVVPGYQFTCSGACVTGEAPRVCEYTRKAKLAGVPLVPGETILAVADPSQLHIEVADDAALPNSLEASAPPETGGEVFHDFGITALEVTPSSGGLYDVDVEVTVIPEAAPTQPIRVELLAGGPDPVGALDFPTVGLPPYTCCVSTCAVVTGYQFTCNGTCVTGEAPRVCEYKRTSRLTGVLLEPGSELLAVADADGLHVEVGQGDALLANSHSVIVPVHGGPGGFLRGDSNSDGALDISDPVSLLGCLFLGDTCPSCSDAADANDDGALDISDALYSLGYVFLGGPAPPAPLTECGADPTQDALDCKSYPACQ